MSTGVLDTCRELIYMKKELCVKLVIYRNYFHKSLHMKRSRFLPVAKTENHQNSFPALVEAATSCMVTGLTRSRVIRIFHSFKTSGHSTALGQLNVYHKWVPGISPEGKGSQCVGKTTLPPSWANFLKILGASISWSPKGLSRPV